MLKADGVHSTQRETAPEIPPGLIEQEARRQAALETLARLRKEAFAEVARLIEFLDATDEYVMTELEPSLGGGLPAGGDDREAEDEHDEPSLGWTDREASKGRYGGLSDLELDRADDEPSLGAIERHPSVYMEGRSSTGDQSEWGEGGRDDREGEHDGAEPCEDGEPWLGWTPDGELGGISDYEQDDYRGRMADLDRRRVVSPIYQQSHRYSWQREDGR